MGFRDLLAYLSCKCASEDNGETKITIRVHGNSCCNRRKIVLNMGQATVSEVESVLRRIGSVERAQVL